MRDEEILDTDCGMDGWNEQIYSCISSFISKRKRDYMTWPWRQDDFMKLIAGQRRTARGGCGSATLGQSSKTTADDAALVYSMAAKPPTN